MTYRFIQCVNAIVFKYFNGHCPNYLDEVFEISTENNFQSRVSFQNFPFHKTNTGELALSYSCPIIWNKTSDTFKRTKNRNTFKHTFKKSFLNELKNCKNFLNLFLFSTIKNPHFYL